PLHAEKIVAVLDQVVWTELAAGQYLGLRRQDHHLILMTDQQVQMSLEGLHPRLALEHLVERHTHSPTLFRLLNRAAKRPGHQLVAEADADQGDFLLPKGAYELAQRL